LLLAHFIVASLYVLTDRVTVCECHAALKVDLLTYFTYYVYLLLFVLIKSFFVLIEYNLQNNDHVKPMNVEGYYNS